MFGYIKPYKPEMKVKEFDTYKAIYCGLCKQLGKVYGVFARFTLSYDFTFLAIISLGISQRCSGFENQKCFANPLKRRPCLMSCDDLSFSASAAMVMFYYKLRDNIEDGGFFDKLKSIILMPFANSARKKTLNSYPYLDDILKKCMDDQHAIEHSDSLSIDAAAEPTATALSAIFEHMAEDDDSDSVKIVLNRLGYLTGRYVYFIDALDDLEDDIICKNYNIFYKKLALENHGDLSKIKESAQGIINLTIGQIASAYELLELKRYKTILDNIIYLGFHDSLHRVMNKDKEKGSTPTKKNGEMYDKSI